MAYLSDDDIRGPQGPGRMPVPGRGHARSGRPMPSTREHQYRGGSDGLGSVSSLVKGALNVAGVVGVPGASAAANLVSAGGGAGPKDAADQIRFQRNAAAYQIASSGGAGSPSALAYLKYMSGAYGAGNITPPVVLAGTSISGPASGHATPTAKANALALYNQLAALSVQAPASGRPMTTVPVAPPVATGTTTTRQKAPVVKAPAPVKPSPRPAITGVSPSPVVGSPTQQPVMLLGSNFAPGAKVSLVWSTGSKVLDPSQVQWLDDGHIQIRITAQDTDTWKATVSNPDGQSTNTVSFQVQAAKKTSVADQAKKAVKSVVTSATDKEQVMALKPDGSIAKLARGEAKANGWPERTLVQINAARDLALSQAKQISAAAGGKQLVKVTDGGLLQDVESGALVSFADALAAATSGKKIAPKRGAGTTGYGSKAANTVPGSTASSGTPSAESNYPLPYNPPSLPIPSYGPPPMTSDTGAPSSPVPEAPSSPVGLPFGPFGLSLPPGISPLVVGVVAVAGLGFLMMSLRKKKGGRS